MSVSQMQLKREYQNGKLKEVKDLAIHPSACRESQNDYPAPGGKAVRLGGLKNTWESSLRLVPLWFGAKKRQWCRLFIYISLWIIFTELRVSWRNGVDISSEKQSKYWLILSYVWEPELRAASDTEWHRSCPQRDQNPVAGKSVGIGIWLRPGFSSDSATYLSSDLGEVTECVWS